MKKLFTILSLAVVVLSSCSKRDESQLIPTPSATVLKALYAKNLDNITQKASFDAGNNYTFISEKGVHVNFYGGCITKNSVPVTGDVDITFVEIFDRGTMLATNKPTVGIKNGESHLLTTGGEFFVQLTQDGVILESNCGYSISAPTSLTGDTDPDMAGFTGSIDTDGNLTWEEIVGAEIWTGFNQSTNSEAYNAWLNSFNWFNFDKFVDLGSGFTPITYTVPSGFGQGSSHIFMASKTFPNSLANAATSMPIGTEVYFILITEAGDKFRYAIKPLQTIVANQHIQFELSELKTATTQQIIDAVNDLP